MAEGVDFSGARPSGICLYANGKRFAVRYFGPGGSWKHATRTECNGLWAGGVDIVAVAEGVADDARRGYSMGVSHAQSAHNAAVNAGMPPSRPIYFAVDFDQQTSDNAAVGAYFQGCRSVIGAHRVGVYGGYRTINWAANGGYAAWFWQTYAWSGGSWSGRNNIEQYKNGVTVCGGTVDLCRSRTADYGQWHYSGQTVGPAPTPPPQAPVVTPWEFTDITDQLGRQVGEAAGQLDGATKYLRSL